MNICPQCHTENPSKALYCMKCGALLVGVEDLPEDVRLIRELEEARQETERLRNELCSVRQENERLMNELCSVRQENENLKIETKQQLQPQEDSHVVSDNTVDIVSNSSDDDAETVEIESYEQEKVTETGTNVNSCPEPTQVPTRKNRKAIWIGLGVGGGVVLIILIFLAFVLYKKYTYTYFATSSHSGHDYVDLGLSVRWATCNIGATSPTEDGDYYAWDETKTNNTILSSSADVASAAWDGSWRMPTGDEIRELKDGCSWTWTKVKGRSGYKITGPNGNCIFLIAAKYDNQPFGNYWASSIDENDTSKALCIGFRSDYYSIKSYDRHDCQYKFSIRPVLQDKTTVYFDSNGGSGEMNTQTFYYGAEHELYTNTFTRTDCEFVGWNTEADGTGMSYTDGQSIIVSADMKLYAQWKETRGKLNGHEWVDLGLTSGTLWATCNVGASNPEDYGRYYAWGETKVKSSYTDSNYSYSGSKSTLPVNCDAANVNWGSGWRIPSDNDWLELMSECTWTWTSVNRVKGYMITGNNGRNIFLPAAGSYFRRELDYDGTFCHYWTRNNENRLNYSIDGYYSYIEAGMPEYGLPIRAVVNDKRNKIIKKRK